MRTLQEFEIFLDKNKDLDKNLNTMETQRKTAVRSYVVISIITIIFVGIFYFLFNFNSEVPLTEGEIIRSQNNTMYYIIAFIVGSFLLSFGYQFIIKRKAKNNPAYYGMGNDFQFDFKDKVIRKIISFWDPDFRYQINNHVKLPEILESGLLVSKDYSISGSDMIRGVIDGIEFKFSDVQVSIEKRYVGKNEDPMEIVLFGSFFMADFKKEFTNSVYIYPAKFFGTTSIGYLQYEGDKIRLEDPEFAKMFEVYSTDQIEARYILTTSMMERIKTLCKKMGDNVYIIFAHSHIYIANNNGKDRFEPSWFKSVNKRNSIIGYFNELSEQLCVIEELKLNKNIWRS